MTDFIRTHPSQCAPNCYIEKWLICGTDEERSAEFQIGLFALRDIQEGEELTYDYGESQPVVVEALCFPS